MEKYEIRLTEKISGLKYSTTYLAFQKDVIAMPLMFRGRLIDDFDIQIIENKDYKEIIKKHGKKKNKKK